MRKAFSHACLCTVLASVLAGQSAKPPAFEVISIKLCPPPPEGGGVPANIRDTPGGINYYGVSLYYLILKAYGIQPHQLENQHGSSTEKWDLEGRKWEVIAKAPQDTPPKAFSAMIQTMLTDRFHLKVHYTQKQIAAYALVVAKGGPKLSPSEPPATGLGGHRGPSGGMQLSGRVPMSLLAKTLASLLHEPVVDETNLSGIYKISLEWMPERPPAGGGSSNDALPEASLPGISLSSAVEQALGLKLDYRKSLVQMLVIDHVDELPIPN